MRGVPLSNFVRNLGGMTGRFVIDKTGLTGPYDLDLQWTPDPATAGYRRRERPGLATARPCLPPFRSSWG